MKHFILILCCFTVQNLMAQRGIYPIKVKVEGTTTTLYSESHALIIGISDYTGGWPKLRGVKKDVAAVKTVLRQNGFNVVEKNNLTKEQMEKAYSDFIQQYGQKADNRLLFYFAGH